MKIFAAGDTARKSKWNSVRKNWTTQKGSRSIEYKWMKRRPRSWPTKLHPTNLAPKRVFNKPRTATVRECPAAHSHDLHTDQDSHYTWPGQSIWREKCGAGLAPTPRLTLMASRWPTSLARPILPGPGLAFIRERRLPRHLWTGSARARARCAKYQLRFDDKTMQTS